MSGPEPAINGTHYHSDNVDLVSVVSMGFSDNYGSRYTADTEALLSENKRNIEAAYEIEMLRRELQTRESARLRLIESNDANITRLQSQIAQSNNEHTIDIENLQNMLRTSVDHGYKLFHELADVNDEINVLKATVDNLKAELKFKQESMDTIVSERDATISELTETIEKMSDDLSDALNRVEVMERQAGTLHIIKAKVETKTQQVDELGDAYEEARDLIDKQKQDLADANKSIKKLEKALKKEGEHFNDLQHAKNKLDTELHAKISELEAEIVLLNLTVAARTVSLADTVDINNHLIVDLNGELRAQLVDLQKQNAEQAETIEQRDQQLAQKNAETVELNATLNEQIAELQQKLATSNEKYVTLENDKKVSEKDLKKVIADLEKQIADLQQTIVDKDAANVAQVKELDDKLEALVKDTIANLTDRNAQTAAGKEEIERLRKALSDLQAEYDAFKADTVEKLAFNATEMENLEAERKRIQAELDALTAMSDSMNGDIENISQVMVDLQEKLQNKEDELYDAEEKIQNLEKFLADANKSNVEQQQDTNDVTPVPIPQ